jgi:hypothetical protein
MTLLELAVWKAKLDDYQEDKSIVAMRRLLLSQLVSGASIVVKNVLPFLKLE